MDCRIKQQETMKSNFMKRAHNYLLLNILLLSQLLQAQNPPVFGEDVQDVPVASIDCWIIPMFILGVFLLSCNYKKTSKTDVIKLQQRID
jgi:hypothetical protein